MFLRKGAITVIAVVLIASADGLDRGRAAPSRVPDPKRVQAERDVLAFLQQDRGRRWVLRHPGGRQLFPRLYDLRTHLLRKNTEVTCSRARGRNRRGRYYCIVRPPRHRLHEGLHLRYVHYSQLGGYFRITWLYYRPG